MTGKKLHNYSGSAALFFLSSVIQLYSFTVCDEKFKRIEKEYIPLKSNYNNN
jgi:hypothetical protein